MGKFSAQRAGKPAFPDELRINRSMKENVLVKLETQIPAVLYLFSVNADGEWSYSYLSRKIEELYEITTDEAIADYRVLTNCIFPDDKDSHRRSIETAINGRTNWSHLHRIRTPKGIVKWVYAQAAPEQYPDGSVTWYGIMTDVTRCLQAEGFLFQLMSNYEKKVQERRSFLDREAAELDTFRHSLLNGESSVLERFQQLETGVAKERGTFSNATPTNQPRSHLHEVKLSMRESSVLGLVGGGKTSKEIAKALGLSVTTVSAHRRNIKRKLGATSATDITRYAIMKFPHKS